MPGTRRGRRGPQPVTVQRRSGLTVIGLRGRIDDSVGELLAETLVSELARRRLKLLTIHLAADTVLHQASYAMLITVERLARAHGKGFGIVYGTLIAGSLADLPSLKPPSSGSAGPPGPA